MPRQSAEDLVVPPRRIAPNGYKLPTQLPDGIVVTDVCDKKWRIGKPIGLGGFGEIYLASDNIGSSVGPDAEYVAKVEAHNSGPLFVEMNFYLRAARREMVDEWVARQDLKYLGMPFYLGSGSFWHKGEHFRFLIIPRYWRDLEKSFQEKGRRFHLKTVLSVGLQVLDILEYVHAQGYVHADIKASNLLVGLAHGEEDRVFLVDFGLATRFRVEGVHKEFRPDLRKAHDGTLEFTSRDAHQGAHSRRGDLEVLAYNMLQWMCSQLPWESESAADPEYVHAQKEGFMKDPTVLLRACFPESHPPTVLEKFLKYVASLGFETQPDYEFCRKIFRQGLREAGYKDDGRLQLDSEPVAAVPKWRKKGRKRASDEPENIAELKPKKVVRISPAQPCRPKNFNTRATRSSPTSPLLRSSEHFDWESVLSSNPEKKFYKRGGNEAGLRRSDATSSIPQHYSSSPNTRKTRINLSEQRKTRGLDNPTPAMLQIIEARKQQKSRPASGQTTPNKRVRSESISLPIEDIPTPAMEEVMLQRQRRPSTPSSDLPEQKKRSRKMATRQVLTKQATSSVQQRLKQQQTATDERLTRARTLLQAAIATTKPRQLVRPTTLELRTRLRPAEGEEFTKGKECSHVETEKPSKNKQNAQIPAVQGHSEMMLQGRTRSGLKRRHSVSPTKLSSDIELEDRKSSKREKSEFEEETPKKSYLFTLRENPTKSDMQYRMKVLLSLDEYSSCTPSSVSESSGSLYEPSLADSDDQASVASLKVRFCRSGGKTPKWRVDKARRGLTMPIDIHRRVTRNCGKL